MVTFEEKKVGEGKKGKRSEGEGEGGRIKGHVEAKLGAWPRGEAVGQSVLRRAAAHV